MDKKTRILSVLYRLIIGNALTVSGLSQEYQVSQKSILRDISTIRVFLSENREMLGDVALEYDKSGHTYRFTRKDGLQAQELLMIFKILSGSRNLKKENLSELADKLVLNCCGEERKLLREFERKEIEQYLPIKPGEDDIADKIWKLEKLVKKRGMLDIVYEKLNGDIVERCLCPVSVIFSEHYFYLLACRADIENSAVVYYRADRIKQMKERQGEKGTINTNARQKMEMAGRYSQKMFMGEYMRIYFLYTGPSVQAVLDQFQTADSIKTTEKGTEISAMVEYSRGTVMTLLSQGAWIKVLGPKRLLEDMKEEVKKIEKMYT